MLFPTGAYELPKNARHSYTHYIYACRRRAGHPAARGQEPLRARAYGGAIVTDGYEAYASWLAGLKPSEPRPQWQMCWAHVRRKFVECSRSSCDPQWSAQVVVDIKPLYAIERKLREGKAPPGEILRTRKETAAKIVENLFQKLQDKLADTANPPLNKLREAIDYALKRRDTLKSWLENPCLPIDNNTVERAGGRAARRRPLHHAGRVQALRRGPARLAHARAANPASLPRRPRRPAARQPHPATCCPRQGVPPLDPIPHPSTRLLVYCCGMKTFPYPTLFWHSSHSAC